MALPRRTNAFHQVVRSPRGGTQFAGEGPLGYIPYPEEYAPEEMAARAADNPRDRRVALTQLLADQNAQNQDRALEERLVNQEMADRRNQFASNLEIDQRAQRASEQKMMADARLRADSLKLDAATAGARERQADREQDFRESQPTEMDVLAQRYMMEKQGDMFAAADDMLGKYRQMDLNPAGKKLLSQLESRLLGIRSGGFRPEAEQELLRNLFRKMSEANLETYQNQQPSMDELLGRDLAQGPDGQWYSRNQYGGIDQMRGMTGSGGGSVPIDPDRFESPEAAFRAAYSESGAYTEAWADAEDRLRQRKLQTRAIDATGDVTISPDEIMNELMRPFEAMHSRFSPKKKTLEKGQPSEDDIPSPSDLAPQPMVDGMSPNDAIMDLIRRKQGGESIAPKPFGGPTRAPMDDYRSEPLDGGFLSEDEQKRFGPIYEDLGRRVDSLDTPEGKKAPENDGLKKLKKVLDSKALDFNIERLFPPYALQVISQQPGVDPINVIASAAAESLEKGYPHYSTLSTMERKQHQIEGTAIIPKADLERIPPENLPPVFFDEAMNLYRKGQGGARKRKADPPIPHPPLY